MVLSNRYLPAHPIVFIMDFSNGAVEVPEYDPMAIATSNDTCVSVRTIADVDGEVTVVLADRPPLDTDRVANQVFAGRICTPSKNLALVTSENQKLLDYNVGKEATDLAVFVDDEAHPTTVWVSLVG